jgi:hypothetical protein
LDLGDNLLINQNLERIINLIKPVNCVLNFDYSEDKQNTNEMLLYFLSVIDILLINIQLVLVYFK